MIELNVPLMLSDSTGKRHAFFIVAESGRYVARGPDLPAGNRSFISPSYNTIEEAVDYAKYRITGV